MAVNLLVTQIIKNILVVGKGVIQLQIGLEYFKTHLVLFL